MKRKSKPNNEDKLCGRNLRRVRRSLEMSQEDIGDLMSRQVSFQQVGKIERGQNRLSAGNLRRISNALNVPLDAFFEE